MPKTLRCHLELENTLNELWSAAVAPKTQSCYSTGFSHFRHFLVLHGFRCDDYFLPAISEDILVYFVAYCYKSLKLQYSTIKLYLSGVRFAYLRANVPSPLDKLDQYPKPRLELILKAVKKLQGTRQKSRLPITIDILQNIVSQLCRCGFSKHTSAMMECACITAFFGFLRCGEFTVVSNNRFEPNRHLCFGDVEFHSDMCILHLKESKTDLFRKGIPIQLHRLNSELCPYNALNRYILHGENNQIF